MAVSYGAVNHYLFFDRLVRRLRGMTSKSLEWFCEKKKLFLDAVTFKEFFLWNREKMISLLETFLKSYYMFENYKFGI